MDLLRLFQRIKTTLLCLYSQCSGHRFSSVGIDPLPEKLTLCPKRMALSLWAARSQREEVHSGPFFSLTNRSSSVPREGRDGLEVLFLMQNLSLLQSLVPLVHDDPELWRSPLCWQDRAVEEARLGRVQGCSHKQLELF